MAVRRFHHADFSDAGRLAVRKKALGQRISVCIPTLNEAETIGDIVRCLKRELVETIPLVDEILVIDSGSDDDTRRLAAQAGAIVHLAADIAADQPSHRGKGENLWKALHVATGDLICYIDGDIREFHSGFVTGLLGPLLDHEDIDYVKAHYERPLGEGERHTTGGGRVSEILVRPLLSLFYPALCEIFQPLSGEYAARRETLESLSFPTGYGVEIAHLIDLAAAGKWPRLAQTDMVRRFHRNRGDEELGRMAFSILQVILRRLQKEGRLSPEVALPILFRSWESIDGEMLPIAEPLPEPERPPLASLKRPAGISFSRN